MPSNKAKADVQVPKAIAPPSISQTPRKGLALPTRFRVSASNLLERDRLWGSGVAPAEDPKLRAQKRVEERGLIVVNARQLD